MVDRGMADALEILPYPEIVAGPGNVVTVTCAHQPTSVILDVKITGADTSTLATLARQADNGPKGNRPG